MKSIRDIYKIGTGPSSSHTMGPVHASKIFKEENPDADKYKVILYGSLCKTGKGHGTDRAVAAAFAPFETEIVWNMEESEIKHPNTMDLIAIKDGEETAHMRIYSIGGGDIEIEGRESEVSQDVYMENSLAEIKEFCAIRYIDLVHYVEINEGEDIWSYLAKVWDVMKAAIKRGLETEGMLPGGLNLRRFSKSIYTKDVPQDSLGILFTQQISAYAYAVAEENADNGIIVTAPTCGSCGVVPATFYYLQTANGFSDEQIIHALGIAGLFGALAKQNASVSGAECGCQAEIGVACSMAAAGAAYLMGYNTAQIEYAAEMSLEHHLGLTCDPVCGLVQIPCIERNAVASLRALESVSLAYFSSGSRRISYDMVVKSMYLTGRDINERYRETSEGGLAKAYSRKG
ncbi:MAG: L-serine ammonia-lyase, iron-sulfur-dependent, subunit alpha [Firmicutes bacterium]|nr:L-serine ammonia-lyase, iron-sulfur-dependent, subunit alpha [Bacillota bacterium]